VPGRFRPDGDAQVSGEVASSSGLATAIRGHRRPVRASDGHATGGRGLLLTQTMANCWGYPEPSLPGKTVWAEVPTQPKAAITGPSAGGPEVTPLVMGQVLAALREL